MTIAPKTAKLCQKYYQARAFKAGAATTFRCVVGSGFLFGGFMAKVRRIITAGRLVVDTVYTVRNGHEDERGRAAKAHITTAAQKALNLKASSGKLERLLYCNFTSSDLYLHLTYDNEHLPKSYKEANRVLRKFLRQLRDQRHREGGEPLRYIYVTEGLHGDKRLHHHLFINGTGKDYEVIHSLWPYGIAYVEPVEEEKLSGASVYLTKERHYKSEDIPNGAQAWTGSKNLLQPKVETMWVSDDMTIELPPKAFVIERESYQNEYGSYTYLKYKLPGQASNNGYSKRIRYRHSLSTQTTAHPFQACNR